MKRSLKFASFAAVPLAAVGVAVAVASPAAASIDLGHGARSYVLTHTYGPFEGQTPIDSEAFTAICNSSDDTILAGSAKIQRKTSHGRGSAKSVDHEELEGAAGVVGVMS